MMPADGSDVFAEDGASLFPSLLPASRAVLLHGGKALLAFETTDGPLPPTGQLIDGRRRWAWSAECWRSEEDRWCGLALMDSVPGSQTEIRDDEGVRRWRFAEAPVLDISPEPVAQFMLTAGVSSQDAFAFLKRHLLEGRGDDGEASRAYQAFARAFITATAERDGFIEVVASPETGGVFAQGWSMSLPCGSLTLATLDGDLAMQAFETCHFSRDDILPPGKGFCAFARDWQAKGLDGVDALFFESGGRLRRLDVVRASVLTLSGDAATAHVAQMLPRLTAEPATLAALRRICRARFQGEDTLSSTPLAVAAAFDTVLRAPDGKLLVTGWLLDPGQRVDRALLKSRANLYAALDHVWCSLPRPDLNDGFARDPRFAGQLSAREVMHGFIACIDAPLEQSKDTDVYLELVLDDNSCLFRPVSVIPVDDLDRVMAVSAAISPRDPNTDAIVENHLAPFVASLPARSRPRRSRMPNPRPLGRKSADAPRVAACLPFRSFAQLQPVFALLAATPDAADLELVLVATRTLAAENAIRIREAFDFYQLGGCLVVVPDEETLTGKFEAGIAASRADWILCWTPSALPKRAGWLGDLLAEAQSLPVPGLLSPAITYEDGSIYFGGGIGSDYSASPLLGYGADWLPRGAPHRAGAAAAEIVLFARQTLGRVGGFSGGLLGDRHFHLDLAHRMQAAGLATWCSGSVEFWMLDDASSEQQSPMAQITEKIDLALLSRRRQPLMEVRDR